MTILSKLCWIIGALLICVAVVAQDTGGADGETPPELEACPPPEGSCAEEVVAHVLVDRIGSWERRQDLVAGGVALTPELISRIDPPAHEMLDRYNATCGAAVTYHNTDGPGIADVLMIAFDTTLNALGFFAAQRTDSAERVLLTSAAYRDEGVLHVYSSAFYFRVEVQESHEEALPSDQFLAARLEVRLPQRDEVPRVIEVMPRGWVNALTVSYEPTDLLGSGLSPMAAGATQMVGGATMRLRILRADDETQAQQWYTLMLQQALDRGRAWEVPRLGAKAFFSENGGPAIAMLQDEFLAHITTDEEREDAEAIMRLVGTEIRITRDLPDDPEGHCPPLVESVP